MPCTHAFVFVCAHISRVHMHQKMIHMMQLKSEIIIGKKRKFPHIFFIHWKFYQTVSKSFGGRICDNFIINEPAIYIHIIATMFTRTKYLHIN